MIFHLKKMNEILNWKHRWFGVWRESGRAYEKCPSIKDFIDPKFTEHHDIDKITRYLETAQIVSTTSRANFPCVLTGRRFSGSLSYRTDGEWLWPDDLAYYVREQRVSLPLELVTMMENYKYQPPVVPQEAIQKLEWPPI